MVNFAGRKVFFLFPPDVFNTSLIGQICKDEYEIYLIDDPEKLKKALVMYVNSILFIDIDVHFTDEQWQEYIRSIMADSIMKKVRIGVLTQRDDMELKKKYLMEMGIQCGYVVLGNSTQEETVQNIRKTLEYNEARGRRSQIRVDLKGLEKCWILYQSDKGVFMKGALCDLSVAGAAFTLTEGDIGEDNNIPVTGIELDLWGTTIKVDGRIVKREIDKSYVCIVMFTHMELKDKEFIQKFIFDSLQKNMKNVLDTL